MKTLTYRRSLFAGIGAASLLALSATVQTAATPTPAPDAATAPDSVPARLPYGVEDVLKLTRAQVSEEVTLNFIHNSGTIYNLSPDNIVYLRNQGVSDRVINTMLDQRKNVPAEMAAQAPAPAAPAAPQAPVAPDANAAAPAPAAPQYAPTYTEPPPAAPASSLYVIPYSGSGYAYQNYYPYYYGGYYPYYYGPSFVFSIGGRYGGYYHGGRYYGGGHYYGGGGHYRGGGHGGGSHFGSPGHR